MISFSYPLWIYGSSIRALIISIGNNYMPKILIPKLTMEDGKTDLRVGDLRFAFVLSSTTMLLRVGVYYNCSLSLPFIPLVPFKTLSFQISSLRVFGVIFDVSIDMLERSSLDAQ